MGEVTKPMTTEHMKNLHAHPRAYSLKTAGSMRRTVDSGTFVMAENTGLRRWIAEQIHVWSF